MASLAVEFGELAGQPITLNSARRMVAIIHAVKSDDSIMHVTFQRVLAVSIFQAIARGFKQGKALSAVGLGAFT